MKVCEKCGDEIDTKDGENICPLCDVWEDTNMPTEQYVKGRKARTNRRRERDEAMRSLGLVKVRGAMGGTYWE